MHVNALTSMACIPIFPLPSSIDLDEFPDGETLTRIQQLGSHSEDFMSADSSESEASGKPVKRQPPILISISLPPVPAELVQRVEDGLFIKMAELSPNVLDSAELNTEKRPPKQLHMVSDIVEWVQCFGIYVEIVSRSRPARVADLIHRAPLSVA